MKGNLEKAKEELKRADHLIYVSLKYTRTVDVIKNIIERLINAFDFGIEALLVYAKKKKKDYKNPTFAKQRYVILKDIFKEEKEISKFIDFYMFLKKIDKAEFTREREFRRHVTMVVKIDGEIINVDIDTIYKYFEKTKEFIEYAEEKR